MKHQFENHFKDLKTKMIEWNNLDAKIFEKSNQTFWEKYNKIPDLERLETEFKAETGTSITFVFIALLIFINTILVCL